MALTAHSINVTQSSTVSSTESLFESTFAFIRHHKKDAKKRSKTFSLQQQKRRPRLRLPPNNSREKTFPLFLANRAQHLADIPTWSPIAHATAYNPPAFIIYTKDDKPPIKGHPQTDPSHSVLHALMLLEALQSLGVPCAVHYPQDGKPATSLQELLLHPLKPSQL